MRLVLISLAAFLAASLARAEAPVHGSAPGETAAAACRHYDNRARFMPRNGPDRDPLAAIADACLDARAALADPAADPARHAAAEAYLAALAATYDQIRAINADRAASMFGAGGQLASAAGQPPIRSLRQSMGLVSRSGEHLIFHAAGVHAALRAWLAAGAAFVAADPAPR